MDARTEIEVIWKDFLQDGSDGRVVFLGHGTGFRAASRPADLVIDEHPKTPRIVPDAYGPRFQLPPQVIDERL